MVLPPPALIGRQTELDALDGLLVPGARVTVVGAGGIGKTALVRTHAAKASHRWCDLSVVRDAPDVGLAVAAALGADADLQALGDELLVLDGTDQLPASAIAAVEARLASAPELRVVSTSRHPVGLRGEQLLRVPPLAPDAAEQLYVTRVRLRQHDWEPDAGERVDIAILTKRLDHLPLAIELAAARRAVMATAEMIERLADRFRLLRPVGRSASVPALVDVLTEAWSGLTEVQQQVLAQCAVFRGGFSLEACSAVVQTEDWHLDVLQELVEASVLLTSKAAASTRFGLAESVRDFAGPLAPDAEALAERHATWVETWLETRPGLGPAFAVERWNITAAVDHLARSDPDRALRVLLRGARLSALDSPQFWQDRIEALAGRVLDPDPALAVRLDVALARLKYQTGDLKEAQTIADRAVDGATALPKLRSEAIRLRAICNARLGGVEAAAIELKDALAIARSAGDPIYEATTWMSLAGVERARRDPDAARRCAKEALALFTAAGDLWGQGAAAASIATDEPELADRWRGHTRAVELARQGGNVMGELIALGNQALQALGATSYATAHQLTAEALALSGPWPFNTRWLLAIHGGTLTGLGELDEADAVLRRAERMAVDSGPRSRIGMMAERAEWHAAKGDLAAAEAVLREALSLVDLANPRMRMAQLRCAQGLPTSFTATGRQPYEVLEAATAAWCSGEPLDSHLAVLRTHVEPREPDAWVNRDITRRAVSVFLNLVDAPAPAAGLAVGPDGAWYRLDGVEVDLSRRGAQRRILVFLAEQRVAGSESTSDLYDLFEAGWPGDRVGHEQVTSRVYNAVQRLRASGLRDVLERVHDGYRLDPAVSVSLGE